MSNDNVIERSKREAFDKRIKELLGDSLTLPEESPIKNLDPMNNFDYGGEDALSADFVIPPSEAVDASRRPINQQSVADLLINAEVLLNHEDTQQMARVVSRSLDTR